MRTVQTWNNIKLDIGDSFDVENGEVFSLDVEVELPKWLAELGDGEYILEMEWSCSGYNDPGSTYGHPEDCHEPWREDERELVYAVVRRVEGEGLDKTFTPIVCVSKAALSELHNLYEDYANEQELDDPADDYDY